MEMSGNFMGIILKNSPPLCTEIIFTKVDDIYFTEDPSQIIRLCQKSTFKIFFCKVKQIIGVNYALSLK